jgi:hypothetical protein
MIHYPSESHKRKYQEENKQSVAPRKRIAVDGQNLPQRKATSHQTLGLRMRRTPQPQVEMGMRRQERLQMTRAKANYALRKQVNTSGMHDFQHVITMNEWLDEWQTAPYDPLPSNIRALSLLQEPAGLDLDTYERMAPNVLLGHYYPDMIPEGRVQQDLQREQKRKERANGRVDRSLEDVIQENRRAKERQGVINAAKSAWTIDLTTEDDMV